MHKLSMNGSLMSVIVSLNVNKSINQPIQWVCAVTVGDRSTKEKATYIIKD
jgi:hypothetical protein